MEYEFSHDPVKGGYHASFSMEHEVFSAWLVDELGDDGEKIDALLQSVENIRGKSTEQLTFEGREYLLTLNDIDVTLALNASCDGMGGVGANDEAPEAEFSVNDDNYQAACGLDDFSMMLSAWRDFLTS